MKTHLSIILSFCVLGCATSCSSKNVLKAYQEQNMVDLSVMVPTISASDHDARLVTRSRKSDVNLGVDRRGWITVNGAQLSLKRLQLLMHKMEDSRRIFLWLDKRCPDEATQPIVTLIRSKAFQNVYRVVSEKDGTLKAEQVTTNRPMATPVPTPSTAAGKDAQEPHWMPNLSMGSPPGDISNRVAVVDLRAEPPRTYFIYPRGGTNDSERYFPWLPYRVDLEPGKTYTIRKDGSVGLGGGHVR